MASGENEPSTCVDILHPEILSKEDLIDVLSQVKYFYELRGIYFADFRIQKPQQLYCEIRKFHHIVMIVVLYTGF